MSVSFLFSFFPPFPLLHISQVHHRTKFSQYGDLVHRIGAPLRCWHFCYLECGSVQVVWKFLLICNGKKNNNNNNNTFSDTKHKLVNNRKCRSHQFCTTFSMHGKTYVTLTRV
jgi:hypothetical protein